MNLRRRIGAGLLALCVGAGLAACGAGAAGSDSAGGAGDTDVAAAQAYVQQVMAKPDGIGYDAPVTGSIPKDIKIAVLDNNLAVTKRTNDEVVKAADVLGWSYERIPVGDGAEDPAKAMDQALDGKPDFIFESGFSVQQLSAQMDRAEKMGVKVLSSCINDEPQAPLIGVVCNPDSRDLSAKAAVEYIVANGNGQDHVQLYISSTFPIDDAYGKSFEKWMKELCPGCETNWNSFMIGDIGTKLPGEVVSAVQRDPKTSFVVFCFGDATVGVVPALESAGLADQVTIGGGVPGTDQYKRMKDGEGDFFMQDNPPGIGWRIVDIAVRSVIGDDIRKVTDPPLVSQLLTKDNIGSALIDSNGFWLGYDRFAEDYTKQWGLG